jgi:FkbM family methyltransferase
MLTGLKGYTRGMRLPKAVLKFGLSQFGLQISRQPSGKGALDFLADIGVRTVLDIGANSGQFSRAIRSVLPRATIHAFEPLREPCRELKLLAATDAYMVVHDFALGDADIETTIMANEFTPASSLLPMAELHKTAYPETRHARPQPIRVCTLDHWSERVTIEEPLFIKLDVQGYEDRVIRGGQQTLRRAVAVLSEVCFYPLYEGQLLFDELHGLFKSLGFRCSGMLPGGVDPTTGRMLFADALFLR